MGIGDWVKFHSPHIPRRAASQELHGLDSKGAVERDDPATAKTDSNFFTRGLSHCLQTTSVDEEATILSKVVPQSRHLYSKSGIRTSVWEYSQSTAALQSPTANVAAAVAGAFFVAHTGAPPKMS
jgi:hypothetical protein